MDKCVAIIVAVTVLGQATGRTYRSFYKYDGDHDHHARFHHSFEHPDPENWHQGPAEWHFPEPSQDRERDHHRYYPHKHFKDQDRHYWRAVHPSMWNHDRWDVPHHGSVAQPWNMPQKRPTAAPVTTSPSSVNTQRCMSSCPVTSEYNPVCGTNNVTYTNPGRLECAKFCGVDVKVKRLSACPSATATNNPNTNNNMGWSTPTTTSRPIFSTDPTMESTIFTSAPSSPTFQSGPTTPQPIPTRTPDNTIPPSILDSIFSIPEEDPNYDLDVRTRNFR